MPRDRSLDEFLGGDDGSGDRESEATDGKEATDGEEATDGKDALADSGPGDDSGGDSADAAVDSADVEDGEDPVETTTDPAEVGPARPTYEWRSAGVECDRCGETVDRRWTASDDPPGGSTNHEMVCVDCKEW